jgi:hypothetical protein
MIKFLPLIILFLGCSKTNDKPSTPPVAPSISVVGASVSNGIMDIKINIIHASSYAQERVNLVIYKTDINSTNWKSTIAIKEGMQDLLVNSYSDASPMNYQILYIVGFTWTYSDLMTLAY